MIGIYKITNPLNEVYVGQSIDLKTRIRKHKEANKNKTSKKLYDSFVKYGVENHKFEVLEECERKELNNRERYYQEVYDVVCSGLNGMMQEGNGKPRVLTSETRSLIGNHSSKRNSGSGNPNYGKTASQEMRTKIALSLKSTKLVLDNHTGIYYYGLKDLLSVLNLTRFALDKKFNNGNGSYLNYTIV